MKNIFFSGRKMKDTGRWWRGTNSIDFSSLLLPYGSLFVDRGREVAREGGRRLHRFRLSICSNQLAVKLQMRRGLDQDKIDNNNWHHSFDNLRTQKESIQFAFRGHLSLGLVKSTGQNLWKQHTPEEHPHTQEPGAPSVRAPGEGKETAPLVGEYCCIFITMMSICQRDSLGARASAGA